MVIGDKSKFAIQYEVHEVNNGELYGSLCLWVSGKRFGDFEDIIYLNSCKNWLLYFAEEWSDTSKIHGFQQKRERLN